MLTANYSPTNQAYIITLPNGAVSSVSGRSIWSLDELRDECRNLGLILVQRHSVATFSIESAATS